MEYQRKLVAAKNNIIEFYEQLNGNCYISFSGGRDSTVLLHLARSLYPDIEAVFIDTGLEYPEIRSFVLEQKNITTIKPKKTFKNVIEEYGYPVVSKDVASKIHEIRTTKSDDLKNKRLEGKVSKNGKLCGKLPNKWRFLLQAPFKISSRCCYHLKKAPAYSFERKTKKYPMLGIRKQESGLRQQRQGCLMFRSKRPTAWPIGSWSDSDIDRYIHEHDVRISKIYHMGYKRTGCMFCMFGCHLEENDRFLLMEKTHPKQHKYCMDILGLKAVIDFIKSAGLTLTGGK
jgi:3'-phosphoadenosine 5'-phosphosulfate sulfotransferase (PAPS reductase)/FAD synthetase